MTIIERAQPLVILGALLSGVALGHIPLVAEYAGGFIVPLLMLMLVGAFLHVPLRGLGAAFRFRHIAVASIVINFVWTPLFAWLLVRAFLSDQPALWVGLLMLMVTPCTDWYLVFTGICKGNLALNTALLPLNLVLQLLLLPVYLFLFAGAVIPLDMVLVLESIGLVLLAPFVLAHTLRYIVVRRRSESWLEQHLLPVVQPAQMALLALAIVAVFASEGQAIIQRPQVLLLLLVPILLFFIGNLSLAYMVSKWLKSSYQNFVSLSFVTLARNSPIALAIAVVAFPDEPLVALALVIGPLIELPVLAVTSQVMMWIRRHELFPEDTAPQARSCA